MDWEEMVAVIEGCTNLQTLAHACYSLNREAENGPDDYPVEVRKAFLAKLRELREGVDRPSDPEIVKDDVFRAWSAFVFGTIYDDDPNTTARELFELVWLGDPITPASSGTS